MSSNKTAVIVDSCGDLPADVLAAHHIWMVPVHVLYPEKDYQDGIDIDPNMIYERFPAEIPTTSTPSIQEIDSVFQDIIDEGYDSVIAICISIHLSSTVNTINIAAQQYPEIQTFIFDTKNISIGSGVFALWAATKLEEGMPFEELTKKIEEKRYDSKLMFYMDTLTYLQKGGRIGKLTCLIGSSLKLKPIIACDKEGSYYTVAKIRGEKQGKQRLFDEIVKAVDNRPCWVIIPYGGVPEEAERMKVLIQESNPNAKILFTKQITASMAVHTGPGLLGLLAFVNP